MNPHLNWYEIRCFRIQILVIIDTQKREQPGTDIYDRKFCYRSKIDTRVS
jgi:hypothetical protein